MSMSTGILQFNSMTDSHMLVALGEDDGEREEGMQD